MARGRAPAPRGSDADRLTAILMGAHDAIIASDTDGVITDWNPAAERLYAYTADEAIGRPIRMLIPPERKDEHPRILDSVRRGEPVDGYVTERLRADGERVRVALTVWPVRASDGTVAGASAIHRRLESVEAEKALARSEAQFRMLVEAAPDPILGVADDGHILFASSRIRDVLGYAPEELIGRPIEQLVPERLRGTHSAHRARFIAQPATRPMGAGRELFALRKNGTEVPVEISLGYTEGMTSAIVVDVSARRAAEADRALLASLVESSGDAIVAAGRDGLVLSWNRAAEEMFGVPAAQALGRSMEEVIPATTETEARRHVVAELFDQGRTARYEATRHGVDGETIVISVTLSPVRDASGAVIAGCAICRDVTAQREAEARTRELAAIVESSLDPIFAVRLDDTVISWNPAAERLYGIPAADALGRSINELLPDPQGDRAALRRRVAAGETVFDHQASRRLADGRRVELSITSFPLRDEAGQIVATAAIVRDVTERKRLEDRLHQTQRIEAVGRLAGGVAHDFNNLLTVITGYSAIAQMHIGQGPGAEELEEVQRAAIRASELTGRLLDFSRQRAIDPVRLDLTAAVDDIVPMLERLIGEDVRIVVLTDDDLPAVLADPGQIAQVIMNLAVNARDAMPHGGTLTIETHAVELGDDGVGGPPSLAPGRYACLTVSDTGEGIDPDVAEHLFEPFFTTKETGKGTGLGLATVHGIVGQAGGDVGVYSEPGLGATFKVYLPAIDEKTPSTSTGGVASPERLEGNETVLLAEDEQALAYLIERILTGAGYRVLATSTPDEALRMAEREHGSIDVLVTDVIMPGLTGPQLAERLAERHGRVPTLFLSGYTADVISDRGHLPSGSAFLEKPFDPKTLLASLRALLERERRPG